MKRVSMLNGPCILAALLLAGALCGCRGTALNPKSDLELRLEAASQETVTADRDKSLASIANDSAEEGNYRLAEKAMIVIHDPLLRDQTASDCATRLVRSGNRSAANKLALTIKDPVIRTTTLRRLADNDVGSSDPATQPVEPLGK